MLYERLHMGLYRMLLFRIGVPLLLTELSTLWRHKLSLHSCLIRLALTLLGGGGIMVSLEIKKWTGMAMWLLAVFVVVLGGAAGVLLRFSVLSDRFGLGLGTWLLLALGLLIGWSNAASP